MNHTETRILTIPARNAAHTIVSMPKTAWAWLDDFVESRYPAGGYKALIREFKKEAECPKALSRALKGTVQNYCESQMAVLYDLANDNTPKTPHADIKPMPADPFAPVFGASASYAYQLFRFLPHPTYLSTVWERRNFHLRGLTPH